MKLIRSFVTAATLALAVTAARAGDGFEIIKKGGAWKAFSGVSSADRPVVGMFTQSGNKTLDIKHFGEDRLAVQMFKTSWQFPKDRVVDVPVRITFDNSKRGFSGTGHGGYWDSTTDLAAVELAIEGVEEMGSFMSYIMDARRMTITFGGNEQPWVIDMTGSRDVTRAFATAMITLKNLPKPDGCSSEDVTVGTPAPPLPPELRAPCVRRDDGSI
jgi:hypothetical protein